MTITRISRIRGYGIFRDFTWPSGLSDFGKYNLIYGWNGSGKTTLGRLIRALERRVAPSTGEATVAINGNEIASSQFPQATVEVRVFNRDFVDENVFSTTGVAPIFILGKQNVDKQREVEALKAKLATVQASLASERQKNTAAESAWDRFCIDQARLIKDSLRTSGKSQYNNYDKANFIRRAAKMEEAGDQVSHCLTETERTRMQTQHRATPKQKLDTLSYGFPDLAQLAESASTILNTSVASASLEALKDDPGIASWVHQGLALHHERKSEACLFCTERIPVDRLKALEAHFSSEYEVFLGKIDTVLNSIQAAEKASDLSLANAAQFYDDLVPEYADAKTAFEAQVKKVKQALSALNHALSEKRMRPFGTAQFDETICHPDKGTVGAVDAVIAKHNKATEDLPGRAEAAREKLEADAVSSSLARFGELRKARDSAAQAAKDAAAEVDRLNLEMGRLEREIIDHRKPADELNQELRGYLGHDELRLEAHAGGYTIKRRDIVAESLSEGERTAIALLYYLKSLEDRRVDIANTVVLLDDPVSSLDANALYSAFGFIRERTQRAAQIFILTHSFSLFRQVRNWFYHLKGQGKKDKASRPARFYMLDCTMTPQGRCSRIRWLDAMLETHDSEYHYLFAYVYKVATAAPQPGLEECYAMPNLARRLLEAFLAFRQPHLPGGLLEKLKELSFDETKKIRIIRFLHTHSHNDVLGEPEHDLSLLSEAQAVLKDLLELMKAEDAAHYSAMESLMATSSGVANQDAADAAD